MRTAIDEPADLGDVADFADATVPGAALGAATGAATGAVT